VYAVPDGDAAIDLLRESLRPADVVLVKASSMVGLSAVAAALAGGWGGHPPWEHREAAR
jgi:UDP-N-acetylmuramoyl-tripeptide--D-alanyl-D-alanine ligase